MCMSGEFGEYEQMKKLWIMPKEPKVFNYKLISIQELKAYLCANC